MFVGKRWMLVAGVVLLGCVDIFKKCIDRK